MPAVTLTVQDGTTGKPIEYAIVTLGGMQGSTNVHGIAVVNVTTTGQLKLIIRHSNYFPINTTVQIPPVQHTIQMMKARM